MLRDAVPGRGRLRSVGAESTAARTSAQAPARAQFEAFFVRHHRELARLAFLLSGDVPSAEDLTAEAMLAAWQKWPAIQQMDQPFAYVRRILVNMAASRVRRLEVERRRGVLLAAAERNVTLGSDPGVAVDVRAALLKLPVRRRACVVLRHAFDLSEADVARVLGISVGTVKSQTFKAMAQLEEILGPSWREDEARERSSRRSEARR